MKHIIHFFVFAIIIAFALMIKLIAYENSKPDWTMESNQESENPFLKFVAQFIGSHPIYYFINNGLSKRGYNITAGVESLTNNQLIKTVSDNMLLNNDPGKFVMHPMYVMLQE